MSPYKVRQHLEMGEEVAADAAAGQHALHCLLHNALREPLHAGCAHIKRMAQYFPPQKEAALILWW